MRWLLVNVMLLCQINVAQAAPEVDSTKVNKWDTLQKKDARDLILQYTELIIQLIQSKTLNEKHEEGKGPFWSVVPSFGYEMISGLTAAIETNTSFYTDSSRNHMSAIQTSLNQSLRNQTWIVINSDIFLDHQRYNLTGNWRIYHFPTNTYGLGSKTNHSDGQLIDYKHIQLYETFMREITSNLYAGMGYMLDYHWGVRTTNPINHFSENLSKYMNQPNTTSSGISLNFQFDSRKNQNNPKQGMYAYIQYRNNSKLIGSDDHWQGILIDLRKYFKLPGNSKNILAFWSYNSFTVAGNPPYLDLPSLGWDPYSNTGRGYIQGRYRGMSMICLNAEYRFGITRNGLFGGVLFGNLNSLSEWPSNQFKAILPAGGLGLRFKLNKHSDVNLCIDYAWGIKGSNGIFFNVGEVF